MSTPEVKAQAQEVARQTPSVLKLQRTSQLKAPKATILVYAPPRWGKTHMIQTARDPLILATELGDTLGLLTLSHLDLPYIELTGTKQALDVIRALKRTACTVEGHRFETIIIDSLSNMGYHWQESAKVDLGWSDLFITKGKGKDPRNAYSNIAERGRQFVNEALELDAHLVIIARLTVMTEGEGDDERKFFAPELPGQKLPREIPGWPDAVLRGDIVNRKRILHTRNTLEGVAGIRTGGIDVPEYIKPNLDAICRLMTGDASALNELRL
jgi:hypothetical protein